MARSLRGLRGYYDSFRESNRAAAGLAKALRVQLQNYLGGGDVSLFEYDEDSQSEYVQQKDPMRAVTLNWTTYQWVVGYGVTLEREPGTFPNTTFQFPVFFLIGDTDVSVDTSFWNDSRHATRRRSLSGVLIDLPGYSRRAGRSCQ
jgi:hypothetical protein